MFFIDDKFYTGIEDFISDRFNDDEKEVEALEDDWIEEIQFCNLEPLFNISAESLAEILTDRFEHRSSEDGGEFEKLEEVLKECIDFEKLQAKLPKLWYGNRQYGVLTKQDLLDNI